MAQFIEITLKDGTTRIYHKGRKFYTVATEMRYGVYSLHCRKYTTPPEFRYKDYTIRNFEGKVNR